MSSKMWEYDIVTTGLGDVKVDGSTAEDTIEIDGSTAEDTIEIDGSTGGSTIKIDDSSSTSGGDVWWSSNPSPIIYNSPIFNITYQNNKSKHTNFVLPEARMPEKFYINGLLMSPGIMGSDADYAYNGANKLVLAPHVLTPTKDSPIVLRINTGKDKIVVEYDNCMYHYTIDSVPGTNEQEKEIQTTQLSQVKKGA